MKQICKIQFFVVFVVVFNMLIQRRQLVKVVIKMQEYQNLYGKGLLCVQVCDYFDCDVWSFGRQIFLSPGLQCEVRGQEYSLPFLLLSNTSRKNLFPRGAGTQLSVSESLENFHDDLSHMCCFAFGEIVDLDDVLVMQK